MFWAKNSLKKPNPVSVKYQLMKLTTDSSVTSNFKQKEPINFYVGISDECKHGIKEAFNYFSAIY